MEDLPELLPPVRDQRFSIRTWIVIFFISLTGIILIFIGFIVLELSLFYLISPEDIMFGEQGLVIGIIAVIIASFLMLAGYPVLIYLYRRSMV